MPSWQAIHELMRWDHMPLIQQWLWIIGGILAQAHRVRSLHGH